jgi:hypothetical protein
MTSRPFPARNEPRLRPERETLGDLLALGLARLVGPEDAVHWLLDRIEAPR